jgi:hypothetical protein
MEQSSDKDRIPPWHGLMYSTSILLIVCGVPATIVLAVIYMMSEGPTHVDRTGGLILAGCGVAAELLLAGILLFVAGLITKRRKRIHTTED